VNLLVSVLVRTSKIVRLANSLFHFKTVHSSKGNIRGVNWGDLSVHAINLPVHTIEHLHLHHPFTSQSGGLMQQVDHHSGTKNSHIGVDSLNFLLTNPLGAETARL